jgi:hypothetical protein
MARTYRRKKASSPFPKYWGELTEGLRDWYRERNPGLTDEDIVRSKCVEYHADNHPGQWNPPSGFGKALNKKVKRDNRLNLIRCLRNDEEFIEIPVKRDSGHDYF